MDIIWIIEYRWFICSSNSSNHELACCGKCSEITNCQRSNLFVWVPWHKGRPGWSHRPVLSLCGEGLRWDARPQACSHLAQKQRCWKKWYCADLWTPDASLRTGCVSMLILQLTICGHVKMIKMSMLLCSYLSGHSSSSPIAVVRLRLSDGCVPGIGGPRDISSAGI